MEGSDLIFFSTEELIAEILRRTTFLGVVIHAEDEYKNGCWGKERMFKVRFNGNLDTEQTGRLLDVVREFIQHHDH